MTETEHTVSVTSGEIAAINIEPWSTRRERQARREAWRKAEAKTRYWKALRTFNSAAAVYAREVEDDAEKADTIFRRDWDTRARWREAVAEQVLTPAPNRQALKWKRTAAEDKYLPLSTDRIAEAIAADEAWLKHWRAAPAA